MTNHTFISIILTLTVSVCFSQQNGTFKDSRDGRVYKTVKIGKQEWMAENLNVDRFRNGDLIPEAKTEEEWEAAGKDKKPAWCYYNNDPSYGIRYGKLYNWYAVIDPRGLAPKGFRVPSNEEWTKLTDHLGGKNIAGEKMKSKSGWFEGRNGTNSSGFSGLAGGSCDGGGYFLHTGSGYWWSLTEINSSVAWCHWLNYESGYGRESKNKLYGISVRCIKD